MKDHTLTTFDKYLVAKKDEFSANYFPSERHNYFQPAACFRIFIICFHLFPLDEELLDGQQFPMLNHNQSQGHNKV